MFLVWLRIHWRISIILKTSSNIKVHEVMFFWYAKVHISWKYTQYAIYWDKTKIFFRQNKLYKKMPSFFFCELQLITFLLLICDSYMKHKVFLSRTVCRIFCFRFCFIFIKVYIFVQQNAWTVCLTLKHHNSFQIKIIEKPHTVLLPGLWFLSYNKKFWNPIISVWARAPQKLT